jgi:hypothetical protein
VRNQIANILAFHSGSAWGKSANHDVPRSIAFAGSRDFTSEVVKAINPKRDHSR